MDLTTLNYFYELSKDMNMTKTAQRLFISQQTLSNHILRLEEDCGVKLFRRKPSLALTYAGEQVLTFAAKVLKEQKDLTDILNEVNNDRRGLLRIGGSSFRLNSCLPQLLPAFNREYPEVEIRIIDNKSENLERMVLNSELDYAIVLTMNSNNPQLISQHLFSDRVYLAVSDGLLRQYYPGEEAEKLMQYSRLGAHLSDFSRLPYCLPTNRMGDAIRRTFIEEGVTPDVRVTTTYMRPCAWTGYRGMMASFVCDIILRSFDYALPPDVHLFPVLSRSVPLTQELFLIHNASLYPSRYVLRFSELMQEIYRTFYSSGEGGLQEKKPAQRFE